MSGVSANILDTAMEPVSDHSGIDSISTSERSSSVDFEITEAAGLSRLAEDVRNHVREEKGVNVEVDIVASHGGSTAFYLDQK